MNNILPSFEPRTVCMRCRRPERVCYCRFIVSIETRTRVVVLQHPREREKAIGTAHMAHLCLPNSELHVGLRWSGTKVLERILANSSHPPSLLYPGADAIDLDRNPPEGPITLVVVDGTWSHAKKLVRENPEIAALPRYAFRPRSPSAYRIRSEPDAEYVSTIEALVHTLGILEGDPDRMQGLLSPFNAMIETQLRHEETFHGARLRYRKTPKGVRSPIPECFHQRAEDIVCVVGEANAWPYGHPARTSTAPDELIHWLACRPASGEVFEYIVAPRNPLAPSTASYVELSVSELNAGGTLTELHERWQSFVRPTDVVCSWGRYGTSLFLASKGYLPTERVDLRQVARAFDEYRKAGRIESYLIKIGVGAATKQGSGRGGTRLGQLSAVVRRFAEVGGEFNAELSGRNDDFSRTA